MKKLLTLFLFLFVTFSIFSQITKTITIESAGALKDSISSTEIDAISSLTITGILDARDLFFMRDSIPALDSLDIKNVSIVTYTDSNSQMNYPENELPRLALFQSSISFISLPQTITTIGLSAFANCTKLTSISIPPSVNEIKISAFANSNLSSVTIPEGVKSIGANAFWETPLVNVVLPSSLTKICNTFFCNENIVSIYFKSQSPPAVYSQEFYDCSPCYKIRFFVPLGSFNLYNEFDQIFSRYREINGFVLTDTIVYAYKNSDTLRTMIFVDSTITATSNQDWLTIIQKKSFTGIDSLAFICDENTNSKPRTATITISAPNAPSQIITVVQDHRVPFLNIIPDSVYIDLTKDTTIYIDVESNIDFTSSDIYSHGVSLSTAKYIGDDKIKVTIDSLGYLFQTIETFILSPSKTSLQDTLTIIATKPNSVAEFKISDSTVTIPFRDSCWEFEQGFRF